jgi:hypothetical protein
MRNLFLAVALCAAIPDQAFADDSSAALGMGGLRFTQSADIRMADEDLRISPKAVSIRFTFANDSTNDIDTIVAFPLPDIDSAEFSHSPLGTTTSDPVNFVGFQVAADGKKVVPSVEQRAFLKDRDVTATLKSAGLPVNVVTGDGYKLLQALPAAARKKLSAAGLIAADDPENIFPVWTVRTRFYWHQHFPAGKSVVFEQSYQPVTGQSMFGKTELSDESVDAAFYAKNFCLDAAARATLTKNIEATEKANPQGGGYLNTYTTDYILKTGNNWKGPIGHFRLTLDKLKPDNVLSLCWDGNLRKTGPTTFESVRDNFAPQSDIRLLVLEKRPPGG